MSTAREGRKIKRMLRRAFVLVLVFAAALSAQPAVRNARPIVVVGAVKLEDNGDLRVTTDGASMRVVFKGSAPDGVDEIRGEFWDLGRMGADNPRLAGYDLKAVFKIDPEGAWPRPGQVTAIIASSITAAEPAA